MSVTGVSHILYTGIICSVPYICGSVLPDHSDHYMTGIMLLCFSIFSVLAARAVLLPFSVWRYSAPEKPVVYYEFRPIYCVREMLNTWVVKTIHPFMVLRPFC